MARLTPITSKSQVAPEGHAAVDSIMVSRGALQGPFTMFLHAPEMAGRVAHLGAYVRFEGELDMRIRVLAAMTVARELDAVYVWTPRSSTSRDGFSATIGWTMPPSPPSASAWARRDSSSSRAASATTPCWP